MSLSFCVLGSGSKGNTTLLVLGDSEGEGERYVLVDCGLSMRATAKQLSQLGIELEQISAIMLTHLDSDHFQINWIRRLRRCGIPVYIHERHRSEALRRGLDGGDIELFREPFELGEQTRIEPVLFAHDDVGTAGFIIEHDGRRLGYATDLGRVPEKMIERFVNLHALAIESNYDPEMQWASNRPLFLKQRITGGGGHLSNRESIEAVLEIDKNSELSQVVTLHLSEQCNDPRLVKRMYASEAAHLVDRLTVTHQRRATPVLRVMRNGDKPGAGAGAGEPRRGEQLAMY